MFLRFGRLLYFLTVNNEDAVISLPDIVMPSSLRIDRVDDGESRPCIDGREQLIGVTRCRWVCAPDLPAGVLNRSAPSPAAEDGAGWRPVVGLAAIWVCGYDYSYDTN